MRMTKQDLHRQQLIQAAGIAVAFATVACFTWLLLIPDPYGASRSFEPLRRANISGYLIHPCVYLCMATLTLMNVPSDSKRVWLQVLALIIAHGLVTEILQYFITGRSCDPFDAIANLAGIAMAIGVDRFRREVFGAYSRVMRLAYID